MQSDRQWLDEIVMTEQRCAQGGRRARLQGAAAARAWCGKPECSTELRAISHRSVALSFQTCAATLYSSTSGSLVRWICAGPNAPPQLEVLCKNLHPLQMLKHSSHASMHHCATACMACLPCRAQP